MTEDNSTMNAAKSAIDYLNRGKELFDQGAYSAAISAFDEAIRLDPNFTDAYIGRGRVKGRLEHHFCPSTGVYSQICRLDSFTHVVSYTTQGFELCTRTRCGFDSL